MARNREDSIIYKSLPRKHGVQVVSINEPTNNSPTGRLMEGIIEVLDELYSSNLAQDVTRGMREAASRGFCVSGRTPYGLRRVHVQDGGRLRTKLEIDPATAPVVRRMFQMIQSGQGTKEIARTLNAQGIPSSKGKRWGKGRVHAMLTDEVYAGTLVWGIDGAYHKQARLEPVGVEGAFPAVVDRATLNQVQDILRSRAPRVVHPRRTASPYLLSGLIRCGGCGAAMFGQAAKSGRYHYYVCATAFRNGKEACGGTPIRRAHIEDIVLEKVGDIILQEEYLEELVRLTNEELSVSLVQVKQRLETLDDQIGDVDRRLERLYDALETGKVELDDLVPRLKELRQRRDLLLRARDEAHETLVAGRVELVSREVVLGYLKELRAALDQGSVAEQRIFLRSFIRTIEKHDSQVTIHYALPLPPQQVPASALGVLDIDS